MVLVLNLKIKNLKIMSGYAGVPACYYAETKYNLKIRNLKIAMRY